MSQPNNLRSFNLMPSKDDPWFQSPLGQQSATSGEVSLNAYASGILRQVIAHREREDSNRMTSRVLLYHAQNLNMLAKNSTLQPESRVENDKTVYEIYEQSAEERERVENKEILRNVIKSLDEELGDLERFVSAKTE